MVLEVPEEWFHNKNHSSGTSKTIRRTTPLEPLKP
jgi:hypothetical protein